MIRYKVFGLVIESAFEIPQAMECRDEKSDITIVESDLSSYSIGKNDNEYFSLKESYFSIEDIGFFKITNGNRIEVDLFQNISFNELSVYLLGSCMGAIFHQREMLPLHGSCVTDGTRSVLITGNSGAGKSTLAAEFLKNGWKLVTDDVCIIKNIDTIPLAQSSYPAQKLWNDSFDQYANNENSISLYKEGEREKFGLSRKEKFYDGTCPLSLIVRIVRQDEIETEIFPLERIPAIEQIRYNTYRSYMIDPSRMNMYFQKCVTLSGKVKMAIAGRNINEMSANVLYEKILAFIR